MCQNCVDEGRLTQEQHDRLHSGEPVDEVMSEEQIEEWQRKFEAAGVAVIDARDILSRANPETKAEQDINESIQTTLAFVRGRLQDATGIGISSESMNNWVVQNKMAEMLAGEMLFRVNAQSLAYGLAVMTMRYDAVLAQWAELYARAAEDVNDKDVNLDAATTPEAKLAVSKVTNTATPPLTPGQYI